MRRPFRLRRVAGSPGPAEERRAGGGDTTDGLLGVANGLVAEGRYRDAIQVLTDANRIRRDHRIEERLVDLRSEAFQELEWPSERPAWPDDVTDLFPGAEIPEVSAEDLTVEQVRSAITHHGSLVVRGLVDEERTTRLVRDIDQALAGYDAVTAGEPSGASVWYRRFSRSHQRSGHQAVTGRGDDGRVSAVHLRPDRHVRVRRAATAAV